MNAPDKIIAERGVVVPIQPRQKFALTPFREIVLNRRQSYLVKGFFPYCALTIVWGKPKCGKSFFAIDAGLHIALKWEYRGRKVRGGPVVYCALEGSAGYGARIEAFRQHHGIDATDDVPFFLLAEQLNLISEHRELIAAIEDQLDGGVPVAVFIDTLNRSLEGSESSDEDMASYISAADAVKFHFGCSVIIVHHCGYEDGRMRGHSSLPGALDAEINVERDPAGTFTATVTRMKDGPEGEAISGRLISIDLGPDDEGDTITSCVVEPVDDSGAAGPKSPRMTKAAHTALRALREAIDELGTPAPVSNHIPQGIRVTTLDHWRTYAYRRGISASDEPRARQTAFKRASEQVIGSGEAVVWEPYVWTPR